MPTPSDTKLRIAVLASGNGSNLKALLDASRSKKIAADIVLVLSDKADAFALERAKKAKVPAVFVDPKKFPKSASSKKKFDHELIKQLQSAHIDLVVLAGFMRILGGEFIDCFEGRLINIHPSLLPNFPGLNAIQQAWNAGSSVSGCTVHFVDKGVDTGPIILQAAVEKAADETLESWTTKIHQQEHRILVEVVRLFAEKRLKLQSGKVLIN
jgi:phosphoribosylglycinamide formyltransferase-1